MDSAHAMYRALAARDARFDGVFFVGVTSTGIYCRPICPARTPREGNCRFFASPATAEKDGFRPCLRCRPELAPGDAPVDRGHRIARLIAQGIEEGLVDDDRVGLDDIAARFDLSARQIRRILQREFGVSPIELILTRRLLLAKQLLTETRLSVTEVAFSSGFASLRRFNDAFRSRYGMPPTRLRRHARAVVAPSVDVVAGNAGAGKSRNARNAPHARRGGSARSSGKAANAANGRDGGIARDSGNAASRRNGIAGNAGKAVIVADASTLRLDYRPPYDWPGTLRFLAARAIGGVEHVTDDVYCRTVALGGHRGWIRVSHAAARNALLVEFAHTLSPAMPALLERLRTLFDLGARPDLIARTLSADARLRPLVKRNPGLRLPGAFDGFEIAAAAILGHHTGGGVAARRAGAFARTFGEAVPTPMPELTHLAPTPERIAAARVDDFAGLGIDAARAERLVAIARSVAAGATPFAPGADPERFVQNLATLPGIGRQAAPDIAMRTARWPDAFSKHDAAVRRALGGVSPADAERASQAWRPWRSYAVLHLRRDAAAR